MACGDCIKTARQREESFTIAKQKAKMYAIANDTVVFLYENEFGETLFMAEGPARQANIQPTRGIISPYTPNA
jgi:hypothetical protein